MPVKLDGRLVGMREDGEIARLGIGGFMRPEIDNFKAEAELTRLTTDKGCASWEPVIVEESCLGIVVVKRDNTRPANIRTART